MIFPGKVGLCGAGRGGTLARRGGRMGRLERRAARILMICPPHHSHQQAFAALAEELRARGHQVRHLCNLTARILPDTPRPLAFDRPAAEYAAPESDIPNPAASDRPGPGRLAPECATADHAVPESSARNPRTAPDPAPRMSHRALGLRQEVRAGAARTRLLCQGGPAAIAAWRPDLILGDQTEPAAGLLAHRTGVPLVSIACALPFDAEPGLPLPFLGWPPDPSPDGVRRLHTARRIAQAVMGPQSRVIAEVAQAWNLGPWRDFTDCAQGVVTLAQTVPGFDHPRPVGGDRVRMMGSFRQPSLEAFPDDIRPDPARPLVYASLGTLQGHRRRLLARVARAARRAGAQVLVSHGGALSPAQAARIPADWVRDFVPQRAVLGRASLCVTHAGMNTVIECLEQGVPMLALPLTNDQPGVAARIVARGVGLRLSARLASESRIAAGIRQLLEEPGCRDAARRFARAAPDWPRAGGAVDIIEALLPMPATLPATLPATAALRAD